MWPGRVNEEEAEVGEASARAVRARSCADIPVVVPLGDRDQVSELGGSAGGG